MVAMEAYLADCEKDPELKSHDDKCRTGISAVMKTLGDGHDGIDRLKHVTACVRELNTSITEQMISEKAKDEVQKLMAGEEECLKLVLQYLTTTSEVLEFCCSLDGFVLSARMCHSYIIHVIEKLSTDNPHDTWRRIEEELEKLKGSHMVDWNKNNATSLQRRITGLLEKYDQLFVALQQYEDKLKKKLDDIQHWKRIKNMIFITAITVVVVLSLAAVTIVTGGAALAPAVAAFAAANESVLVGIAGVGLTTVVPGLAIGDYFSNSALTKDENKIKGKVALAELMKSADVISRKELGDINVLIDNLRQQIDAMVMAGKDDPSFGLDEIKNYLGRYVYKIKELENESDKCTKEIREGRDAVMTMIKKNYPSSMLRA